jgi:HD-GYP domain-containing protein (c-di-GMP phosphodiesterase class II)
MSPDIAQHGIRTAWLAERLCEQVGLGRAETAAIAAAARTHDVGKEQLPQELLEKPASLTRVEHGIVRQHCAMGAWMLRQQAQSGASISGDAVAVALLHHEWWNGHGYPFGLKGREIPLAARIVSVADVFDALCSERSYKSAWPVELALEYIRNRATVQFDPWCVEALLSIDASTLAQQYAEGVERAVIAAGRVPAMLRTEPSSGVDFLA